MLLLSAGFPKLRGISTDDELAMTNSKDTVMIRLLDACVTVLKGQGVSQLFLDGIKGGHDGFLSLGELEQQFLILSPTPLNA